MVEIMDSLVIFFRQPEPKTELIISKNIGFDL